MGVDKLFNSLEKTINIQKNGIHVNFDNKIPTDYLYDDFNSTIYITASEIEKELNYLLYEIILNNNDDNHQLDDKALEYAKKWNFDVSNVTLDSYQNYFTSELIDNMTLIRIQEYMIYKCSNLVEPNMLKLYMISIDGVPQMAKEREQKKRRFNGEIISRLKNKIHQRCEEQNLIPHLRKLFELNKISYDRGKIISWTNFMKSVEIMLTSDSFHDELKKICPNLDKVIVSHQNIYGEGEKKIMEHILESNNVGNYTFFSPDADAILLGIIAQNTLNNGSKFVILRHNQQTQAYDMINIDTICQNIYNYVCKNIFGSIQVDNQVDNQIDNTLNKQSVTNDVAFIFTLFGNDFIPRVESIDVRNNIETLIDVYCNTIKKAENKFLIYKHSNSSFQRICYYNFAEFIKN